ILVIGVLAGLAGISITAGVKAAKLQTATRGVLQYVRQARAIALLKGRPVVVHFEEMNKDGAFSFTRMSLEFTADSTYSSSGNNVVKYGSAETLTGEVVTLEMNNLDENDQSSSFLLEPQDFEGIHVRVGVNEEIEVKSRISVFSNVDFLLKQAARTKKTDDKSEKKEQEDFDESDFEKAGEESGSIVYETNGRCDPYIITIWEDGTDPEKGLKIKVDKFGKMKEESREEDE
ncbi:MAG: hypothetical protein J6V88_06210, partial [Kiritimatiellae bacterium]|nr:hypothetical protein [Kiritimatiellia bacterium]